MNVKEIPKFLSGGGNAGDLIRSVDWTKTELGEPALWPQSLKTSIRILLDCKLPMHISWGKNLIQFYNDAYRPILGNKHPKAMGISIWETWDEIWPTIGPMFEDVLKGNSIGFDDFKLTIERYGYPEDCYFNFSYSPIPNDIGEPNGVLVTFAETTERVISEQKLQLALRERDNSLETLETINKVGQRLTAELDLEKLVQQVTDDGTRLTGAQFGAFFYNSVDANGESLLLNVVSGVSKEEFAKFPNPRATAVFHPTFVGAGTIRSGNITKDTRYGHNAPYNGLPPGHLPVRSYLAVSVVSRTGEVIGGLFFGHSEENIFTEQAEKIAEGLASQAAVAMDNARLYRKVQESVNLAEAARQDLHGFFMQAPVPMVILEGPDHFVRLANPLYERFVGRKVVGKTLKEAFSQGEADYYIPIIDNVYQTGIPYVGKELPLQLPNEKGVLQNLWIDVGYYPRRDEMQNITGVLAIVHDVTTQVESRLAVEIEKQKFEAIFFDSPASMALLRGPIFIFEKINSQYSALMGGRDLIGKSLHEALPELIGQPFHQMMKDVFETGKPYVGKEIKAKLVRRIGGEPEDTYFDFTYSRIDDSTGKPYGIYIHAFDITDKVNAGAIVKAQKQAFELTLKEAPLTEILELLVETVESQSSHETLASVLLLDGEGKRLLHGAAPSLPEEYNQAIHGVIIGPEVGSCGTAAFKGETTIVADISTDPLWKNFKDLALSHNLKACWSTPIFSSKGDILGTFALYHRFNYTPLPKDMDLVHLATQTAAIVIERQLEKDLRLAAEESSKTSEDRLNLALISGNIGFWDWNAKTGHTFLSDTLMRDWHINPATFNNTLEECLNLIVPEDRERVWKEIEGATFQKLPYDVDYRVQRPEGDVIWVNAKGRYFLNRDGEPERLSGITINITDRRHVEEKLREAVQARDEFLSIASHELKTPLTSLKLQAQIQMRFVSRNNPEAYSRENVDDFVALVDKQTYRLTRLIDDMLDVSRIRSGRLEIRKQSVDLSRLATEVVHRLKDLFVSASYQMPELQLAEDAVIFCDPLRIEQVLVNLLTNAVRYGNSNPITVTTRKESSYVQIIVQDKGIGIKKGDEQKIFNRFERAVSANEVSGLGLGLFITKQIVSAHGGMIRVESDLGHGSRFIVDLPEKTEANLHTEVENEL